MPFFVLLILFLPRFIPIFTKLEEKGELPTTTLWLLWLNRLNAATFGLPTVAFLTLLLLADLGMARGS